MPRKSPDLKAEVWAELKAGKGIVEAYLSDSAYHLDGYCEGRRCIVNPAPSVVETAAHEIVHRIRPKWGERRVTSEARRMLARMTEREVKAWYRTFQRVAKKQKKTVRVGD